MPNIIEGILDRLSGSPKPFGLALSGGGARGFAHLGVLKAFDKFAIKPDYISGVSAGAIAGSLYSAGLTPDEILERFQQHYKLSDYTDWAIPKVGFMKLNKFADLLDSWLPVKRLEECKIPLIICATDIDQGKSVGWSKGDIVPRVIASCSIPIIFNPMEINGKMYVDGGVLRNLPAWAIRDKVKVLFGSNCSPLNRNYEYKSSMLDVAFRSYQLMAKANTLQDINLCDHIIQSKGFSRYGTFQLSQMKRIMDDGYDAACQVLEKCKLS